MIKRFPLLQLTTKILSVYEGALPKQTSKVRFQFIFLAFLNFFQAVNAGSGRIANSKFGRGRFEAGSLAAVAFDSVSFRPEEDEKKKEIRI